MEKILDIITEKMERAFADAGYDASYGRVTVSNRPDLCEYQCNGALAAAKQYHCAPIPIAKAVAPCSRPPGRMTKSWTPPTILWWRPSCRASLT